VSSTNPGTAGPRGKRRPRSDGEQSRTVILDAAARLATVEGIGGLSIARLADAVGMSKSGLFGHFGSKEELQLATVEKADSLFAAQVIEPASTASTALQRLRLLVDGYLRYVEVDTFPGGCFFASVLAEVDMQPGAVRDAQAEGAIDPQEDAGQLAFEVEAALFLANAQYVVTRTAEPIERARRAIDRRLATAVTRAPS